MADGLNRKLYQLMISGIVPRPIAFVSSISEAGIENLAPFRCFISSTQSVTTANSASLEAVGLTW